MTPFSTAKHPSPTPLKAAWLFLLVVALPAMLWAQDANHIPYDPDSPLTWSDFEGKPIKNHEAHALTSYEVMFSSSYNGETGEMQFEVTCVFVKDKSWVKEDPTDLLLKHEQGHFDIAEIYTRKLRKELGQMKFNPKTIEAEVGKIYNRLMKESHERQRKYDKETDHSKIKEKQAEWDIIIAKELKALEAFQAK